LSGLPVTYPSLAFKLLLLRLLLYRIIYYAVIGGREASPYRYTVKDIKQKQQQKQQLEGQDGVSDR